MPLYKRHRVIESVMNECLGLHNKPKAEVHPWHKLTGPKEEEEEDLFFYVETLGCCELRIIFVQLAILHIIEVAFKDRGASSTRCAAKFWMIYYSR